MHTDFDLRTCGWAQSVAGHGSLPLAGHLYQLCALRCAIDEAPSRLWRGARDGESQKRVDEEGYLLLFGGERLLNASALHSANRKHEYRTTKTAQRRSLRLLLLSRSTERLQSWQARIRALVYSRIRSTVFSAIQTSISAYRLRWMPISLQGRTHWIPPSMLICHY